MRFAICNELFKQRSFEDLFSYVRSLGYEGVEIAPYTLGDDPVAVPAERRRELRRAAESRGVEIIGLHWLLVKPPGLYITHPDQEVRDRTSDYFAGLVQLCHDLGGSIMVIGSPKQRNLMPGVSPDQGLAYATEVFAGCMPLAASLGVILAIEPLGPAETNFINTAAEGIDLVHCLGHPNFRLHLDVKAMSSETKPIPQVIHESAGQIAHFHVNDPNLRGPGMGDVDHRPIVAALREVGYDDWLSVEAFDTTIPPEQIAEASAAYLKQVCG